MLLPLTSYMVGRRGPKRSSEDPEINLQPENKNPHDSEILQDQQEPDLTQTVERFLEKQEEGSNAEDIDSPINSQPETTNPHNSMEEESSPDLAGLIQRNADIITQNFDEEELTEQDLYMAAYQTSKKLEEELETQNKYLMAEIGPNGVKPMVVGDTDSLRIDTDYSPDRELVRKNFEESNTLLPVEIMRRTGTSEGKLRYALMNYEVEDIDSSEIQHLKEDWPISEDAMAKKNYRIIVSPGLTEEYGNIIKERYSEEL